MSPRDLTIPGERHPEKAHRPDNAQPKKPAWIRVKAPTSEGYKTHARHHARDTASSRSARRRAAPTSANAGARATPP